MALVRCLSELPMATWTADFLDSSRNFWQRRTETCLGRDDAREISETTAGFFRLLMEWDAREGSAGLGSDGTSDELPTCAEGRPSQ